MQNGSKDAKGNKGFSPSFTHPSPACDFHKKQQQKTPPKNSKPCSNREYLVDSVEIVCPEERGKDKHMRLHPSPEEP